MHRLEEHGSIGVHAFEEADTEFAEQRVESDEGESKHVLIAAAIAGSDIKCSVVCP